MSSATAPARHTHKTQSARVSFVIQSAYVLLHLYTNFKEDVSVAAPFMHRQRCATELILRATFSMGAFFTAVKEV